MLHLKHLFCLLCLSILSNPIKAQYHCTITPLTAHQNQTINCLTTDRQQNVWAGTANGLINLFTQKHILKGIEINKIAIDTLNNIWLATETDTIKKIDINGNTLLSFHFSKYIPDTLFKQKFNHEYIESISTTNFRVIIGLSNGSLLVYGISSGTFRFHYIQKSNNSSPIKHAYVYPKPNKIEYSKIICTDTGLYTDPTGNDIFGKIPNISKSYKILPSRRPEEIYWLIGRNNRDNSIIGKIITRPKDPDAKNTHSKPYIVTSECLLPNYKIKFNDFALTSKENVWVATNKGLIYYIYNDNCLVSKLIPEETGQNCSNQSLVFINKEKYKNFPLDTINYIACPNDSTICFASKKGSAYKMTITTNFLQGDSTKIEIKNVNIDSSRIFRYQFNFKKCEYCTNSNKKIKTKQKKSHEKYTNEINQYTLSTGEIIAADNLKKIEQHLNKDYDQRYDIHIFGYAPDYENETLSKKIAEERASKIAKQIETFTDKKRIKIHIIGYLPSKTERSENKDIVIVELKCSNRDYHIQKVTKKIP